MQNSGEPCCQSPRIKAYETYEIKFGNSLGAFLEVKKKIRKMAGSVALIHGSMTQRFILTNPYHMEGSEGRDYSCSAFEHLSGLASSSVEEIMRN